MRRPWWTRPRSIRRHWCIRRGHPMAKWSPTYITIKEPDRIEGGVIVAGREFRQIAWRCAKHDDPERPWR